MAARSPFTAIIPARYASQRFPGKPLALIDGKTMLRRVYEQTCRSEADSVHIVTDDERIAAEAKNLNASVLMTSPRLTSGTERIFAAAVQLRLPEERLIINVQGDEPLIPPENINQLAHLLTGRADMASLVVPIEDENELKDENCVKVVSTQMGQALYFSRSIIPHSRNKRGASVWRRHLGIYAYRVSFLRKYVHWKPCAYEIEEKLEQLRALYYGAFIRLAVAQTVPPPAVDTPEDIKRIEALLKQ